MNYSPKQRWRISLSEARNSLELPGMGWNWMGPAFTGETGRNSHAWARLMHEPAESRDRRTQTSDTIASVSVTAFTSERSSCCAWLQLPRANCGWSLESSRGWVRLVGYLQLKIYKVAHVCAFPGCSHKATSSFAISNLSELWVTADQWAGYVRQLQRTQRCVTQSLS